MSNDLDEYGGYRDLWAGVLRQAIKDLDVESEALSAKRWMYKYTIKGVGSYHWVCNMLDIDENKLAIACLTREGRRKVLGPHYKGLHEFQDRRRGELSWPEESTTAEKPSPKKKPSSKKK